MHEQKFISIDDVPDFRTAAEKSNSSLSVFNHNKPDLGYVERLTEEFVNVGGAVVTVYLKIADLSEGEDLDFEEDAHPVYSSGIPMKAFFKPEPRQIELLKFGIDVKLDVTLTFHRASLIKNRLIGDRLLLMGDLIKVPYNHLDEKKEPLIVRVNNATPTGNFHFRWMYHQVTCQPITADELLKPRHE